MVRLCLARSYVGGRGGGGGGGGGDRGLVLESCNVVEWIQASVSGDNDRKTLRSNPTVATLLWPWKRHFTVISFACRILTSCELIE